MFPRENLHISDVNLVHALEWIADGDQTAYKVTINGVLYSGADTAYEANVIAYSACIMLQVFGYKTKVNYLSL